MTISDRLTFDDVEIRVQERTAELEKANQALHTEIIECKSAENELIKLKDKLEAEMTCVDTTVFLKESTRSSALHCRPKQKKIWNMSVYR